MPTPAPALPLIVLQQAYETVVIDTSVFLTLRYTMDSGWIDPRQIGGHYTYLSG